MKKWKVFGLFSFISVFVIALVSLSPTQVAAAGQWTLTGSTAVPHGDIPMTTLLDGRVITTSSDTDPPTAVTEIYDEQTGQWSQTGSVNLARRQIVPVTLNDGRVLIAGGLAGGAGAPETTAAELYDPTTGVWSYTGSLNQGRAGAILVKLHDGRVLAISGQIQGGNTYTTSSEIYDPASGQWTMTGNVNHAVFDGDYDSDAVVLDDGRVLLVGSWGWGSSSMVELYDPATGVWTPTGSLLLPRYQTKLLKLQDGRVLMIGGDQWGNTVAECEIYDPATGTWTPTGSLNYARSVTNAVLLPDGRVFVAGGDSQAGTLRSSEIYDPNSGTWTLDATLNADHSGGQITMLPSGRILMAGGYGSGGATTITELYTLDSTFTWPMNPAQRTTIFAGFDVQNGSLHGHSKCYGTSFDQLWHTGEDWAAAPATPIFSVADGVVSYVSPPTYDYPGAVVIIQHTLADGSHVWSMYGHLDPNKLLVSAGATVQKGQEIASGILSQKYAGNDNTHLHWEIRFFADGSGIHAAKKYTESCSGPPAPGYTYPGHPQQFVANGGTGPTYSWTNPSAFVQTH